MQQLPRCLVFRSSKNAAAQSVVPERLDASASERQAGGADAAAGRGLHGPRAQGCHGARKGVRAIGYQDHCFDYDPC